MNTLYYLCFNNYYNRIVKRYNTIDDYLQNSSYSVQKERINFIPGDGVLTTQIVNWPADDDHHPDYLLVCDDSGTEILSRWFIIESKRTSATQYQQTLKRDTFVDNYDIIVDAPMFVEKATVGEYDPAIYNTENMTFNQIKTSEHLLKDATEIPWLVGYIPRDYNESVNFDVTTYYDEELSSFGAFKYNEYLDKNVWFSDDGKNLVYELLCNSITIKVYSNKEISISYSNVSTNVKEYDYPDLTNEYQPPNYVSVTQGTLSDYLSYDGKVFKVGNVFYKINIKSVVGENNTSFFYYNKGSAAAIYGNELLGADITNACQSKGYCTQSYIMTYEIVGQEEYNARATIDLSANRQHCSDSPFDMFCIPYGNYGFVYNDGTSNKYKQTYQQNNFTIATGLASLSSVIKDIQLLPYCPLSNPKKTSINFTQDGYESNEYQPITINGNVIGFVLWCDKSTFTRKINYTVNIPEVKIANECETWRLCSPNYNDVFEFNAAKNIEAGSKQAVSYFTVDCAYKPFTPYIHIAPDFKGLYGGDFNDARGLICSGDFGITSVTDKWSEYQITNKNYQASFDRQIESMELEQKWSRISDASNIFTSTAGGGAAGFMVGGAAGAAIGAAAGLADSSINMIANGQFRRDALDMTKDQFGYSLGNIKALPATINKVSTFNQNNKIFPFVEYYTATDVEKQALRNKIKYNGMTVGRIGTIKEFLQPESSYIKGKLIRLDGDVDFHEVNDIANELNQGVYIGGE